MKKRKFQKSLFSLLISMLLLLSVLVGCGGGVSESPPPTSAPNETVAPIEPVSPAPEKPVTPNSLTVLGYDVPLMVVETDPADPNYYKDAFVAELYNYKLIRNIPTVYESVGWEKYWSTGNLLANLTAEVVNEDTFSIVQNAINAREALTQTASYAECVWYIWGEDTPIKDCTVLTFDEKSWDSEDFAPFLVPYLLEDQSAVKGNLIAIAGGGYTQRNNTLEGYPIAEAFNALGYNCYVLQRRVAPYAAEDAWMDLQRAVRYLRYNAEELGIGGMDCMIAAGFSGGGGTISGTVSNLYGEVQPTIYDASYVSDAVDAENSDLDYAFIIYGPIDDPTINRSEFDGWTTDNPNLPEVFIAAGYDDPMCTPDQSIALANYLEDKTRVELHLFANSLHGFGVGVEGTNATYWIPMADVFASEEKAPVAEQLKSGESADVIYHDVPVKECATSTDDPNYYVDMWEAELYNYKLIRNIPTAYESTGWNAYWRTGNLLVNLSADIVNESTFSIVQNAIDARKALVQIKPYAECVWEIWGANMATANEASVEFLLKSWDNEDFVPYLVPYLLEDQSAVKGNLIAVAGGGYSQRNNTLEGYPIAEAFNALGYNCYVLQRRVAPYAPADAWMDLQRAIRYLRYNAEELGIGGMDCIMAAGFSGGGGTVSGTVATLYGDLQPTVYDPDYVPDAVDGMSADLDIAYIVYGPMYDLTQAAGGFSGWHTENPNLPAIFLATGYADPTVSPSLSITLANELEDLTTVELHVFADALHGFGVGLETNAAPYWIPMADQFAEQVMTERRGS